MKQCERCGIDEDDPRARQACASVDSPSPYHLFSEPAIDYDGIAAKWDRLAEQLEQLSAMNSPQLETCPSCYRRAVLSDETERSVIFEEAICEKCRQEAIKELYMDSFDIAYERARANGWAD